MTRVWPVPELESHCGSWIVVNPMDGESMWETFSAHNARVFASRGYVVLTAAQWLGALNHALHLNKSPAELRRAGVAA